MTNQGIQSVRAGFGRSRLLAIFGTLFLSMLVGGVLAAPFVFSLIPYVQSTGARPTDAQMIAHWKKHRDTLEQIAAMLKEDEGLKRLGKDWADPDDLEAGGISPERAALYRKLMRGADIVSVNHFGRQVELVYYTTGIYVSGGAKSFCFGPPPEFAETVEGDLDAAAEGRRRFILQRQIEGDWWLEFESV